MKTIALFIVFFLALGLFSRRYGAKTRLLMFLVISLLIAYSTFS
jgi:hypothetical protein